MFGKVELCHEKIQFMSLGHVQIINAQISCVSVQSDWDLCCLQTGIHKVVSLVKNMKKTLPSDSIPFEMRVVKS